MNVARSLFPDWDWKTLFSFLSINRGSFTDISGIIIMKKRKIHLHLIARTFEIFKSFLFVFNKFCICGLLFYVGKINEGILNVKPLKFDFADRRARFCVWEVPRGPPGEGRGQRRLPLRRLRLRLRPTGGRHRGLLQVIFWKRAKFYVILSFKKDSFMRRKGSL